ELLPLAHTELDICDSLAVKSLFQTYQPTQIINAAAYTKVDDAEKNSNVALAVNAHGPEVLAENCPASCRIIHISTDFVFDGKDGPYDEHAIPHPVNVYGESKLLAEEMVQMSKVPWAIVRTITVYGPSFEGGRTNFVTRVQQQLSQGVGMKVVNDQWRTPTYVIDLAKGILLVMMKNARGIYHISGNEMLTPYELGCMVANMLQLDAALIMPVASASLKEPAMRPLKTGFVITKAIKQLGYVPTPLVEGLRKTFGLNEQSS
ncbi:MAG: SDR family oxidoreductase, partial [Chitinophagaceae bacterium]